MSPDLTQKSDRDLAALAQAGREEAHRELVRRYKTPVYQLIARQIGDADEALDLTQETFVSGFAALDRFDADRSFRIWISSIAINKCRDWARRRKVRAFFSWALPLEDAHHVASDGPAPDLEADARLELERVRVAIDKLPQKLREVLVLRGIEEANQAETAAILQVSEKTVETRLYRARSKLRQLLGPAEAESESP